MTGRPLVVISGGLVLAAALFLVWQSQEISTPVEVAGNGARQSEQVPVGVKANGGNARQEFGLPRQSSKDASAARNASMEIVELPPREEISPLNRGIQAWQEYYASLQVAGGAPSGRTLWWTDDDEIVRLFMMEWEEQYVRSTQELAARRELERSGELPDSGREFLDSSLQHLDGNLGALNSETLWFEESDLGSQSAKELAQLLRRQSASLRTGHPPRIRSQSMMAPFSLPLESHVASLTGSQFADLDSANQQYLREAYAQVLLDAAELASELEVVRSAVADRSLALGLPAPDPQMHLGKMLPEIAGLEAKALELWRDFARDIEEVKR